MRAYRVACSASAPSYGEERGDRERDAPRERRMSGRDGAPARAAGGCTAAAAASAAPASPNGAMAGEFTHDGGAYPRRPRLRRGLEDEVSVRIEARVDRPLARRPVRARAAARQRASARTSPRRSSSARTPRSRVAGARSVAGVELVSAMVLGTAGSSRSADRPDARERNVFADADAHPRRPGRRRHAEADRGLGRADVCASRAS